jgi:hypothetical protein
LPFLKVFTPNAPRYHLSELAEIPIRRGRGRGEARDERDVAIEVLRGREAQPQRPEPP